MSNESSSLSQHPFIEGVTLFSAEPAPHEHKVHAHDAYSVIVLTSGQKHFHHQGDTIEVMAEQIAVANPGELHGCGPVNQQPWSHRTWYLSREVVEEISTGLGFPEPANLLSPVIRNSDIARCLIDAHLACREECERLESQSIALSALSELFRCYSVNGIPDLPKLSANIEQRMAIYESLLNEYLTDNIELTELAERAGVKRNQVIKDFKQAKGVTPGNYFRLVRLQHAKELIRDGLDLAQTSSAAGFADQSHFTRCFKSAFGVTPNSFRKLTQSNSGHVPL